MWYEARWSALLACAQAAKVGGAAALPASLRLAATLPGEGKKVGKGVGKSLRRKELKEDVSHLDRVHLLRPRLEALAMRQRASR